MIQSHSCLIYDNDNILLRHKDVQFVHTKRKPVITYERNTNNCFQCSYIHRVIDNKPYTKLTYFRQVPTLEILVWTFGGIFFTPMQLVTPKIHTHSAFILYGGDLLNHSFITTCSLMHEFLLTCILGNLFQRGKHILNIPQNKNENVHPCTKQILNRILMLLSLTQYNLL